MDSLVSGLQALRLAQFFSSKRSPGPEDLRRLKAGRELLRQALASETYAESGVAEGLEADALGQAHLVVTTLERLRSAKATSPIRQQLADMLAALEDMLSNPSKVKPRLRRQLENLFSAIGQAFIGEVTSPPPPPDEEPQKSHGLDVL